MHVMIVPQLALWWLNDEVIDLSNLGSEKPVAVSKKIWASDTERTSQPGMRFVLIVPASQPWMGYKFCIAYDCNNSKSQAHFHQKHDANNALITTKISYYVVWAIKGKQELSCPYLNCAIPNISANQYLCIPNISALWTSRSGGITKKDAHVLAMSCRILLLHSQKWHEFNIYY